jgi:hypothetical protein
MLANGKSSDTFELLLSFLSLLFFSNRLFYFPFVIEYAQNRSAMLFLIHLMQCVCDVRNTFASVTGTNYRGIITQTKKSKQL